MTNLGDRDNLQHAEKTIDEIVESYVAHMRAGTARSVASYQEEYPHLAEEIGAVLPSLQMLEDCRPEPQTHHRRQFDADDVPPTQLGEYQIVHEIGRGGMGIVYEADHVPMRRHVALKVLPKSMACNAASVARFHQEARSAGQLHHTNIVPVFEVGEQDGFHFYAMQFIRGQNLDVVIDEIRWLRHPANAGNGLQSPDSETQPTVLRSGNAISQTVALRMVGTDKPTPSESSSHGDQEDQPSVANMAAPPSTSRASHSKSNDSTTSVFDTSSWSSSGQPRSAYFHRVAALGRQVADALSHAHHNHVLHRDIKPSNLILDTDGIVWITDFGLAKGADDDLTKTGDIVGTLRYMAPERFQGQTDARTDIYSLGLTLYELCTLRCAFQNTDRASLVEEVTQRAPTRPRNVDPLIPKDLETIILKAIDRIPERRYQSAERMAEDLEAFVNDRPIRARRVTPVERLWRACRRNPVTAGLTVCSLMLLITVAIGASLFALRTTRDAKELAQQNQRAERHLLLAEESIDRMITDVADELSEIPQMDAVHRSLLREALALQQKVLDLEQGDDRVALRTVHANRRLAKILDIMGDHDAALSAMARAITLATSTADNEYDKWLALGTSRSELASMHRVHGSLEEAEKESLNAVDALSQIPQVRRDFASRLALADAYRQLGAVQQMTGKRQLAKTSLESALNLANPTPAQSQPLDPAQARTLSETLNSLAILCRSIGDYDQAQEHYIRSIEITRGLVDAEVELKNSLDQLGVSALNLGNLLILKRDYEQALDAYQQSHAAFESLVEDFPNTVRFKRRIIRSNMCLAIVQQRLGRFEESERLYLIAIEDSGKLDERLGPTPGSLEIQAVCYNNLGNLFKDGDMPEAAGDAYATSIDFRRRILDLQPTMHKNRNSLALAMGNLGNLLNQQGASKEGRQNLTEAFGIIEPLIRRKDIDPQHVRTGKWLCRRLSELDATAGNYEDLLKWVLECEKLDLDPETGIHAARQMAVALQFAANDASLGDEGRITQNEALIAQAISSLEEARRRGWAPTVTPFENAPYDLLLEHPVVQSFFE